MNIYEKNNLEALQEINEKKNLIKMLNSQIISTYENDIIEGINKTIKYLEDDIFYLENYCLNSDLLKKYPNTFIDAQRSEKRFENFCKNKNIKCIKTDKATDMRFKTDFFIYRNNERITVDVKGIKKNKRNGETNSSIQWLEFQNVRGYKGTIYSKVNVIAFERENDFVLVNKNSLLEYAEKLKINAKIVYDVKESLYNLYQRKGNKDLTMKVFLKDIIENCEHSIWTESKTVTP